MQHIVTSRGIDFEAYAAFLATIRDRLPAHVAAFASDSRHFSLSDRESLHDAWLERLTVHEPAQGDRAEIRRTAIEIRLLGQHHDRTHVLRYDGVRHYECYGSDVARGHCDLYTHEVRLASDGVAVVHELLFAGHPDDRPSSVLIECTDFTHEMVLPATATAAERQTRGR